MCVCRAEVRSYLVCLGNKKTSVPGVERARVEMQQWMKSETGGLASHVRVLSFILRVTGAIVGFAAKK